MCVCVCLCRRKCIAMAALFGCFNAFSFSAFVHCACFWKWLYCSVSIFIRCFFYSDKTFNIFAVMFSCAWDIHGLHCYEVGIFMFQYSALQAREASQRQEHHQQMNKWWSKSEWNKNGSAKKNTHTTQRKKNDDIPEPFTGEPMIHRCPTEVYCNDAVAMQVIMKRVTHTLTTHNHAWKNIDAKNGMNQQPNRNRELRYGWMCFCLRSVIPSSLKLQSYVPPIAVAFELHICHSMNTASVTFFRQSPWCRIHFFTG